MKQWISLFILALWGLGASAQPLSVRGRVEGIDKGRLLFIVQTAEQSRDTLAAAEFRKGKFSLTVPLQEPTMAILAIEGYAGGFSFVAEPACRYDALLKAGEGWFVKGGTLQNAHLAYLDAVAKWQQQRQGMQQRFEAAKQAGKLRTASGINDSIAALERQISDSRTDFLRRNDNVIAAQEALQRVLSQELPYAAARQAFEQLGTGAKGSPSGRILQQVVARLKKTTSGAAAPDFTLPTLDGRQFALRDMPGKIKIIDFWASWCGPCRLNNPHLKRLYAQYHDKGLELVGISLAENRDLWQRAVEKDGLPWTQVSSLKGWRDETARAYSVAALPAVFILDADNHIVATNLRGEALDNFLEEQLAPSAP